MNNQSNQIKKTILEALEKHKVKRAALFGSVVRKEATEESDIDVLIEFERKKKFIRPCRFEIGAGRIAGKEDRCPDLCLSSSSSQGKDTKRTRGDSVKKDAGIFIEHILEGIELIEEYVENKTEDQFLSSGQLQDSVIRRIEKN